MTDSIRGNLIQEIGGQGRALACVLPSNIPSPDVNTLTGQFDAGVVTIPGRAIVNIGDMFHWRFQVVKAANANLVAFDAIFNGLVTIPFAGSTVSGAGWTGDFLCALEAPTQFHIRGFASSVGVYGENGNVRTADPVAGFTVNLNFFGPIVAPGDFTVISTVTIYRRT